MSFKCGFVAIVGRPNVGKSTLLNHLIGRKLSITSRRAQTTRHAIIGIHSVPQAQILYVDTPGMHRQQHRALNRYMNRAAFHALHDVDVVLWVIEALRWNEEDQWVAQQLKSLAQPVILVVNKIDQVKDRTQLLPFLEKVHAQGVFHTIIPVSGKAQEQLPILEREVLACLPEREAMFSPDQLTDQSDDFLVQECIREKLIRTLGQELPYSTTVTLEIFEKGASLFRIGAVIWVERENQKAIVIGEGGERLKKMATQARLDLEKLFDVKVLLKVWVKVKTGWTDDEKSLETFGYR